MVAELIDKYVFLLQTFAEAGGKGLSLEEISSRWESRYGEAYPRRSFINHRKAIEDVFGIVITCDRSTNRYMIDAAESAMDKREAVEYLINTFTVRHQLRRCRALDHALAGSLGLSGPLLLRLSDRLCPV